MSTESFANAVYTELETWRAANYSTLAVAVENGPELDESTLRIWVDVELRWYGSSTMSIEAGQGARPLGRHSGTLSLQVYSRAGEGTQLSNQIVDSLNNFFRSRRIGGGILKFGQRTVPTHALAWFKTGLFIPFHLDVA